MHTKKVLVAVGIVFVLPLSQCWPESALGDPELTEPPSTVISAINPPAQTLEPVEVVQEPQKQPIYSQIPSGSKKEVEQYDVSWEPQKIKEVIVNWANYYGISEEVMLRVAKCESGYQQYAVNKKETPGNSPTGVFQFKPQTFYGNAKKIGLVNPDILSPDDQAHVASYMFSIGQSIQWSCK